MNQHPMNWRQGLLTVLRKELRDTARDRRSLLMVLLFVVIYPLVMWSSLQRMIDREASADNETNRVVVVGADQVPGLVQHLGDRHIDVIERDALDPAAILALLRERKHAAVIRIGDAFGERYQALMPAPVELWHDSSSGQQAKLQRIESVLRDYGNDIAQARLLAHGVSPAVLSPIALQQYDSAGSASRSASFIGAIVGIFFVATFYFCMSIAIDSTAGERERRSLELLMAQPVAPAVLIGGKWLAAALICVVGLALELLFGHLLLQSIPLEEIGMSWRLGAPALLLVLATAVPLCLFAAAFEIALAINSKSFKEAQTSVSFALLLPLVPVIVVPMLNLDTQSWMYAVPVLAEQTLLLELARGHAVPASSFLTAAGVSLAAAALCLAFAARRIRSERFVLGI